MPDRMPFSIMPFIIVLCRKLARHETSKWHDFSATPQQLCQRNRLQHVHSRWAAKASWELGNVTGWIHVQSIVQCMSSKSITKTSAYLCHDFDRGADRVVSLDWLTQSPCCRQLETQRLMQAAEPAQRCTFSMPETTYQPLLHERFQTCT